jgi:hypothetical protein
MDDSHEKAQKPQKEAGTLKLPSHREGLGEGFLPLSSNHHAKRVFSQKSSPPLPHLRSFQRLKSPTQPPPVGEELRLSMPKRRS